MYELRASKLQQTACDHKQAIGINTQQYDENKMCIKKDRKKITEIKK